MSYIAVIESDEVIEEIKKHGKIIAKLPKMPEGRTLLIETNLPKTIERLPGVKTFGPNRKATVG